jgi:glycosyltransferase involved in cell wall biosynthesis
LGVVMRATPASGGTYQYSLSMLEALGHISGYDVTLYADASNPELARFKFPMRHFVEERPAQFRDLAADTLRIRRADPFAEEDVLIAPTFSLALLHTARPFVYTLHDLQEYYYPDNFSWIQRAFRRRVYLRLSDRAAAMICESEHVKSDIVRWLGVADEKVAVIISPPLGQPPAEFSGAQLAEVRDRLGLEGRFFFYPAQFWPHKNHLRLIEALRAVVASEPGLKLVLTGKPRDEYETVMQAVRRADLEKSVLHLGYIEQADLQAIYHLALALVMPSLFESVSIPVYEAFQAGTPVLASDLLAIPEQVGDAGLLFDPLSSGSIAARMLQIARDSGLASTLSSRGRERMAAMTPQRCCSQIEALLGSIASYTAIRKP